MRGPEPEPTDAGLSIRIDFGAAGRLGPGKIRLLELIAAEGSIAAAARRMAMSYRRAWLLVEAVNATFLDPAVATAQGGRQGGGASLTPFGHKLVETYRAIEAEARAANAERLDGLARQTAPPPR